MSLVRGARTFNRITLLFDRVRTRVLTCARGGWGSFTFLSLGRERAPPGRLGATRRYPVQCNGNAMSLHITTDHVAELGFIFTDALGDALCENTFYVRDTSDDIFTDPSTFTTAVWTQWIAHVVPALASTVIYNAISFEDQRNLPYIGITYGKTPVAGSVAAGTTAMPNNTAIAIKRLTAAPGRGGRGRLFMPLWANVMLSGENTVSSTVVTNIQNGLATFQTNVEAISGTIQLGVVSKQLGGSPRANGVFNHITQYDHSDLVPDSMRRRLPLRGH